MKFRQRTLSEVADMICGNPPADKHFCYRTGRELTMFFEDADASASEYPGGMASRARWVESVLEQVMTGPWPDATTPPEPFPRIITLLMEQEDATGEPADRPAALAQLNSSLKREGFEALFGGDKKCYLRHIATKNAAPMFSESPHRPFSTAEVERRQRLAKYLDGISEDEFIEDVLLPLFRQLGFHRITSAGHKDKALEYGKDIWMRFRLPTQHYLYFGVQAKKDKLDAAGMTKQGNVNVAEVHHQALMMLAHEIFDPETGKRVLVDHAFIVSAGEITKQARNWIGNALDDAKRSQIMFIDRDDILNLYVVSNLPLPKGAQPPPAATDDPWATPPF
jgi:Restriction endonuclease